MNDSVQMFFLIAQPVTEFYFMLCGNGASEKAEKIYIYLPYSSAETSHGSMAVHNTNAKVGMFNCASNMKEHPRK